MKDKYDVNVSALHQWTDGCPGQYKGKNAFHDISKKAIPVQRNFFTTSHGKNVCDGLGAVVKNMALRHIKGYSIVSNAVDMFDFCCMKVAHGPRIAHKAGDDSISIRDFIYVAAKDVTRERCEMQTLVGTRKLHAVKSVGTALKLQSRNLSCYCMSCAKGNNNCTNKEYVNKWAEEKLKLVKVPNNCVLYLIICHFLPPSSKFHKHIYCFFVIQMFTVYTFLYVFSTFPLLELTLCSILVVP